MGEWREYGPAKEFCGGASSSAEQFCQIAFDCVHAICQGAYYTRALFTESMSVGTLQGSCVALPIGMPVVSGLGGLRGCLGSSVVVSM